MDLITGDHLADIVGRTWLLFNEASDVAYRVIRKKLRPIGVSPEQARVLLVLSRSSSPPTRTEIGRIVMRKPHSVTALLNRMQSAGLISRIKDAKNQQLVRVVMTPKGSEALKQVMRTKVTTDMMAFVSSEEYRQLGSILEKFRDAALKELEMGPP